MSKNKVYLAVDLGASSGRVIAAEYKDGKIQLDEINRFETVAVELRGSCYWDILGIFDSILTGLRLAEAKYGDSICSIGVDAWGVDYGLFDKEGNLLGNPHQYRDTRTNGMIEKVCSISDDRMIYAETGIQFMFFNTLFQLFAEKESNGAAFDVADRLLFIPDIINFWLSGKKACERTIASTSQMLNPKTRDWSRILDQLEIPLSLLGEIVEPGTVLGDVIPDISKQTNLKSVKVIAVGSHDTASAIAGVPSKSEGRAYLSSGTWSLMGIEANGPIITGESMRDNFSNEIGVEDKVRFLKNICGGWLIQQSKDYWMKEGDDLSYSDIVKLASEAKRLSTVIDPDDPAFASAGDMPNKIQQYCKETGQTVPETKGEILLVAFESLAAKYKLVFDKLNTYAEQPLEMLHVVGGGSQNEFLCQATTDALNIKVIAGPVEATSMGNIITQMLGMGDIKSIEEGREIIAASTDLRTYEPNHNEYWDELISKLKGLIESKE